MLNSSWTQASPLSEGLVGNAWESSNRKYCFRPPPPTIVVSVTTTTSTFSLSLYLSLPPGWWSLRWDSKIWPWVLRDFNARMTALAWPRSNCTINYRPVLSSERALQNNKRATVWRKCQGERKIGHWSQMRAWHQDGLSDWLSVVIIIFKFNFNFRDYS
jgi:hypothetical protein